uniref:non-specific serine/threonine protein kinase n=1 Tax=Ictidomys tridecemlineatus TaxID=43179 RepID=I3N8W9_ICTTR
MKGSGRLRLDHRTFIEQVRECMDNGYLLSSKRIGSGAFSKVYLAYATQEPIKIVSMAEAPVEFSQKFLPREISSLNATYKHLNVVQLYETYQNSQRFYLVLELAARGDLLEHINAVSDYRHCPGLEEEEARRLFWQLVSAVAHCHNAGIVHRDLKCENILLDDQGFLKLTDFGFANHSSLKNSLLSTFCGSVAYTAPEILMSKKYNGEQADLWSLGIILYAMVTGKLPFKESQPHRMLHLMRRGPIFQPGLSPECRDLIRGLLHLRPRARLGLQQVAAHRWMIPAVHTLFCSSVVVGTTSGGAWSGGGVGKQIVLYTPPDSTSVSFREASGFTAPSAPGGCRAWCRLNLPKEATAAAHLGGEHLGPGAQDLQCLPQTRSRFCRAGAPVHQSREPVPVSILYLCCQEHSWALHDQLRVGGWVWADKMFILWSWECFCLNAGKKKWPPAASLVEALPPLSGSPSQGKTSTCITLA